MRTIPLGEARDRLEEILANLLPGEEVVILRDDKPVATLRAHGRLPATQQLGTPKARALRVPPDLVALPEELGGEA